MFVYEEMIDGKKLTEIINTTHENIKYLPGHQLPPNVVSITSFVLATYVNFQVLFLCAAARSSFTLKMCNISVSVVVAFLFCSAFGITLNLAQILFSFEKLSTHQGRQKRNDNKSAR